MEIGILWLFHIKYPQRVYINILRQYGQQVGKASSRRPSERLDENLPSGCPQACIPHLLSEKFNFVADSV